MPRGGRGEPKMTRQVQPKPRDLFDDSVKGPTPKPTAPAPYNDSNPPVPKTAPKPRVSEPAPAPSIPQPTVPPRRTRSVEPSGGPENAVTFTGLDGNEYSTNAELQAANAAYLAAQETG